MLPQKMRTNEILKMWNDKLSDVCDITPRNDALILLGDFYAKTWERTFK
jgi:hypothetical protein